MSTVIDPIVSEILVAIEDGGKPEGGKTSYPDYPGEHPSKTLLNEWVDSWSEDLGSGGYSAVLRGELPFEIAKLAPRPPLDIPRSADPARKLHIEAANDRIVETNAINKTESDARLKEIKVRIASKIIHAMRRAAPIALDALKSKHQMKDEHDVLIDAYDGVAMFNELKAKKSEAVRRVDTKRYDLAYEKIRDHKLPDNVSPEAWSKRLATFTVHVNPYKKHPLSGRDLSEFIVEQLPSGLASDGRSLQRDAVDKKKFDDVTYITGETQRIVEDAYDPSKKPSAMLTYSEAVKSNGSGNGIGNGANATKTVSVKTANKMVAAAIQDYKSKAPGNKTTGKESNRRGGNRLPEGQYCSSGTCNFDHDRLKPGKPCYRQSDFEGPLPQSTYDNEAARTRIENDKMANSKRLGTPYKPFKPQTAETAAKAGAVATLDNTLVDLFGAAPGMMVHDGTELGMQCYMADDDDESGYGF